MKIVLEVVATNMESGHIAIRQETIKYDSVPRHKFNEIVEQLKTSDYFTPKKIGPILIARSFLAV